MLLVLTFLQGNIQCINNYVPDEQGSYFVSNVLHNIDGVLKKKRVFSLFCHSNDRHVNPRVEMFDWPSCIYGWCKYRLVSNSRSSEIPLRCTRCRGIGSDERPKERSNLISKERGEAYPPAVVTAYCKVYLTDAKTSLTDSVRCNVMIACCSSECARMVEREWKMYADVLPIMKKCGHAASVFHRVTGEYVPTYKMNVFKTISNVSVRVFDSESSFRQLIGPAVFDFRALPSQGRGYDVSWSCPQPSSRVSGGKESNAWSRVRTEVTTKGAEHVGNSVPSNDTVKITTTITFSTRLSAAGAAEGRSTGETGASLIKKSMISRTNGSPSSKSEARREMLVLGKTFPRTRGQCDGVIDLSSDSSNLLQRDSSPTSGSSLLRQVDSPSPNEVAEGGGDVSLFVGQLIEWIDQRERDYLSELYLWEHEYPCTKTERARTKT